MQKIKLITHAIVFLFISNIVCGQTTQTDPIYKDFLGNNYFFPTPALSSNISRDVFPSSPRAASLGVFGKIPVGNFTGAAQISIPLYEIQYKELSVPIQISYQASGNKPDAFPGPIGLGWAIQAGGSITRQINGESDMGLLTNSDHSDTNIPHLLLGDPREESTWPNMGTAFGYLQGFPIVFYRGDNDIDPDEYNFNINGHTGKFYLSHIISKDTFQIQSAQGESFLIIKHPRTDPVVTFPVLEEYFPPNLPVVPPLLPWPDCEDRRDQWNSFLYPGCNKKWDAYDERYNERMQILEILRIFYGVNPYLPEFKYTNKLYLSNIIGGFTMIDSNGIKYIFGATDGSNKSDKSIEFSRPGLNKDDPDIDILENGTGHGKNVQPVSWHLTAIESPQGYKIEFIYEQESYIVKTRFTDLVLYRHPDTPSSTLNLSVNGSVEDGERVSFINGCYLKEIIFPSGKISFSNSLAKNQRTYTPSSSYNEPYLFNKFCSYPDIRFANVERIPSSFYSANTYYVPHQIDAMTAFDNNNNIIRKIDFQYSSSSSERLKLTRLSIKGADDNVQNYSFLYNESLKLPGYLSGKTDHYGFYNGTELFPNPDRITFTLLGNYNHIHERKTPNSSFTQAEILNKITYPTKGYTVFEYEPHDYSKMCKTWPFEVVNNSNGNQTTGGVRIKSIKDYDSNNSLLTEKKYYYTTNYLNGGSNSSGVLAYIPQYTEIYNNKAIYYHNDAKKMSTLAEFYRFSTTSLYNAMALRRNHITYSEVTVEEPGNGFVVYKYKNHDNGYGDKQPLYYCSNTLKDVSSGVNEELWKADEGISMELERGQTLSEEVFDNNKNPKKKVSYSYNDNVSRFDENVRYVKLNSNSVRFIGYRSQRLTAGVHYTYFPYLKEKTETNYFGSDIVEQKENYVYDERYRLIKSIKQMDSRNQEYKTEMSYTVDQGTDIPIVGKMIENKMFAYPFEKTLETPNGKKIKEIFEYRDDLSSNAMPLAYKTFTQYDDNTPIKGNTIVRYDLHGNPNEVYDKNEETTCILWSYNSQYPVVEIKNASYSQVENILTKAYIDNLTTSSNPDISAINNLRNDSRLKDAMITTYTYKPLVGVLTVTNPQGITAHYEYDGFGRLKEVYYYEDNNPNKKRKVEEYEYHYK
ncbi:MAG: hypothetical protein LBI82_11395 [Dysgonamonadaceae bacterium]|jgi:hypothetical protein|nr:hypothetical protein [Dysgonamonadaceae bacterium]